MEMGLVLKKQLKRESYTLVTLSLSTLSLLFFAYYYLASLSTLLHNVLNNNSSSNFKNSKAIFFLCNAIVVFLAKDSGLLEPSTTAAATSDFHGEFAGKKENHPVLEKSCRLVGQIKENDLEVEAEEKVMELVVVGGGEEKEEEINGVALALEIVNGVVEEFEEDEGVDELNRRFEEFIKKMKREIIREEALSFGLESKRRIH